MHIHIHIHIYIHMCVYIYIHTPAHTHANTHTHTHIYIYICAYTYTHLHIYIYMYTQAHTYISIYIYIYICMYGILLGSVWDTHPIVGLSFLRPPNRIGLQRAPGILFVPTRCCNLLVKFLLAAIPLKGLVLARRLPTVLLARDQCALAASGLDGGSPLPRSAFCQSEGVCLCL